MARPIRIHVPGGFYHITLRGNHRREIFTTTADRALLNVIVAASLDKYAARAHAYCWMSNHIHLLVEAGEPPVGNLMRSVASGYARAFQRKLETTGHLFERRYHAVLVDTDAYLLEVVRYIHLNPVRARMALNAASYRWSSHHAYLGEREDDWVTTGTTLGVFANARDKAIDGYRRFMDVDAESIPSPFDDVDPDQPYILGRPEFVARFAEIAPRRQALQSLELLLAEACARFHVTESQLAAHRRDPNIARIRAWFARQAKRRKIARLAAVARMLACDPKTLRHAMKRYPDDDADAG